MQTAALVIKTAPITSSEHRLLAIASEVRAGRVGLPPRFKHLQAAERRLDLLATHSATQ
jgi:hypothetical protein